MGLAAGWVCLAVAMAGVRWEEVAALPQGARQAVVEAAAEAANPPGRSFVAASEALEPAAALGAFTVPPGFDVQLVASEPEIQKPMQLCFDARGRLLVSTSTNYPLGPAPGGPPSDRVMALEIDGLTGRAVAVAAFAEGFDICSGIEAMPDGSVLLANAPDLLRLRDGDGDGRAELREVLYTGFARDDVHELPNSFTWGVDGWVYLLQGHVNVSDVRDRGGRVVPIHHGGVFRFQPDGARIETYAPGMSNPWGLAFDAGYQLFAADCESRPLWQIVQGFRYPGFLQANDPLGYAAPITDDPHGASGFAGLVHYTAAAYPEAYRDCLYLGGPITGRVHCDRLEDRGSTRMTRRAPDFLVSEDPWFRPVDVELGPDGALYVADWYNRIIAHVEVPLEHPGRDKQRGRIWRIVYRGGEAEWRDRARGPAIARQFAGPMATDWAAAPKRALIAALGDPNGWVRRTASQQLHHRIGDAALPALQRVVRGRTAPPQARAEALWLLQRAGVLDAVQLDALHGDAAPVVRQQAARMLRLLPGGAQDAARLFALAGSGDGVVQREALMALGAAPDAGRFARLVQFDAAGLDPLSEYAYRAALRDHLADDGILGAAGALPRDDRFVGILAAAQTPLAAGRLAELLERGEVPQAMLAHAIETLLSYGSVADIQRHLAGNAALFELAPERLHVYAWMLLHRSGRAEKELGIGLGPALEAAAQRLAASGVREDHQLALDIAAARGFDALAPFAAAVLDDAEATVEARRHAAALLSRNPPGAAAQRMHGLLADAAQPRALRRTIAEELGSRAADRAALDALLAALAGAPASIAEGAYEQLAGSARGAALLMDAVEAGRVAPGAVNAPRIRARFEGAGHAPGLPARYAAAVQEAPAADAEALQRVERYAAAFGTAARDRTRGRALFAQYCVVCHRVGGEGAYRGPNLDGIGGRGLARVLQDVMMPSHDIDPAFLSTIVRTKDGAIADGMVTQETADGLIVVGGDGWETPIAKADIAERRKVWVSPMPPNFADLMPEPEFLDLIAFLLDPVR